MNDTDLVTQKQLDYINDMREYAILVIDKRLNDEEHKNREVISAGLSWIYLGTHKMRLKLLHGRKFEEAMPKKLRPYWYNDFFLDNLFRDVKAYLISMPMPATKKSASDLIDLLKEGCLITFLMSLEDPFGYLLEKLEIAHNLFPVIDK